MSIHHVRDNVELPLIADDQNYSHDFPNFRTRQPVKILQGDHLFIECGYDTRNSSEPLFGGPSLEEEACSSLLFYYPKITLDSCGSENIPSAMISILGVTNITE